MKLLSLELQVPSRKPVLAGVAGRNYSEKDKAISEKWHSRTTVGWTKMSGRGEDTVPFHSRNIDSA